MLSVLTSVEVLVSLAALGVAIWAHVRTSRISRESNDLQARLVALEEAREADRRAAQERAELTPHLEKRPGRSGRLRDMLVISNRGAAAAKDVHVTLDETPIDEHGAVMCDALPVPVIGPGADSAFVVAIDRDHAPPFHVRVMWSDGVGEERSYETTLTAS